MQNHVKIYYSYDSAKGVIMGRELRRVPLDFDYPLGKVWYGFFIDRISTCIDTKDNPSCEQCKKMAEIKGIPMTDYGCPDFDTYLAEPMKKLKELLSPPTGDGYQLWETTTEGSPMSPVFATLDELCGWCEKNVSVYANFKVTKEEWRKMLENGFICYKEGDVIYL